MGDLLGEKNLNARIQEIKSVIARMDQRWDHGFFSSEEEYVQQRIKLQLELEQLTPVPDDELEQAADMLTNFKMHWERLEGDEEARHELVKPIVERVYVCDDRVVAMTLRSNYHLVLNHKTNEPTEFSVDSYRYTNGSDGNHSLTRITLIVWFLPKYVKRTPPPSLSVPSDTRCYLSV